MPNPHQQRPTQHQQEHQRSADPSNPPGASTPPQVPENPTGLPLAQLPVVSFHEFALERKAIAIESMREKLERWLGGIGTLTNETRESLIPHGGIYSKKSPEEGPGHHIELRLSLLARIDVRQPLLSKLGITRPREPIEVRLTSPVILADVLMNSEFEVQASRSLRVHQRETFNADAHKNAPSELRSLERALPYFRGMTLGTFLGSHNGELSLVAERWKGQPKDLPKVEQSFRGRRLSPKELLDEIQLCSGSRYDRESGLSETITRKVGLPQDLKNQMTHAYSTEGSSVEIQFSCHRTGEAELLVQIDPEKATVTLVDPKKPKTPPLLCFVASGPEEAAIFTKALLEGYRIGKNVPNHW